MIVGKLPATAAGEVPLTRVLTLLHRLFAHHETVEALLQQAAQIAVELLPLEHCRIALFAGDNVTLGTRGSVSRNGSHLLRRPAGSVPQNLNPGVRIQNMPEETGDDNLPWTSELKVNGEIIGRMDGWPAARLNAREAARQREAFLALGAQIGRALEAQKTRHMLASQYTMLALSRSSEDSASQEPLSSHILAAVKNPEKVAVIVARSFYRDLRKAGFEPRQVLVVASELIENLNLALRRTKAKTEEENETD
ncbi:MAG: hypothetical protein ONB48_18220 [candidate division KSB1 bacterium]|nr:hypothetical protein [candidate division KSB1 bacterium]MDZ7275831.1 hypothetical protein [candidate division KSB1 bacterium]MDZ7287581.1 hypothetical protein [candidate division KSB1 bacterium]MDZ7306515.1 hypothetical protein [candidate division KSB1 bacterium]MDZ7350559.1 hypothetical protein [candidate division KSB1 bacterium]